MLPETLHRMLKGLIARADSLGGAITLRRLWTDETRYSKHLIKRVAMAHVADASDLQQKTWLTLSQARHIAVVQPADPAMHATGKLEVRGNAWAVLLSERGRIVTAYRIEPKMIGFEERHRKFGDQVHVYTIDTGTRGELARIFGAR